MIINRVINCADNGLYSFAFAKHEWQRELVTEQNVVLLTQLYNYWSRDYKKNRHHGRFINLVLAEWNRTIVFPRTMRKLYH